MQGPQAKEFPQKKKKKKLNCTPYFFYFLSFGPPKVFFLNLAPLMFETWLRSCCNVTLGLLIFLMQGAMSLLIKKKKKKGLLLLFTKRPTKALELSLLDHPQQVLILTSFVGLLPPV
jgi:hypothetical protein